ncbi:unnamed protein product [Protopolystoma xenopodis]|uniref:Uncharacterized protein n=1 Tax=Protopolystoma xenopodis TaxID=117903 RepID=A0A448WZI5_9PLAT|nr:unnamed protein product [Protopolystoma xenopodis]
MHHHFQSRTVDVVHSHVVRYDFGNDHAYNRLETRHDDGATPLQLPFSEPHNSDLSEAARQQMLSLRSVHRRNELLATVSRLVRCFDAELRVLRNNRFYIDTILKRAELSQLTSFDEYRLLKEFEKSELVLTERARSKAQEKQDLATKANIPFVTK